VHARMVVGMKYHETIMSASMAQSKSLTTAAAVPTESLDVSHAKRETVTLKSVLQKSYYTTSSTDVHL
jgi:hypothetical protein